MSKISYVIIAGINAEGVRQPVAEISAPTIRDAKSTMLSLVGKTTDDALALPGAEPDGIGWNRDYGNYPLAGFTIATYHEDEGTTDEIDFDKDGRG